MRRKKTKLKDHPVKYCKIPDLKFTGIEQPAEKFSTFLNHSPYSGRMYILAIHVQLQR